MALCPGLLAAYESFHPSVQNRGYNSGGTYVLSNAAMRLFAEELYGNSTLCPFADYEDVGLAA